MAMRALDLNLASRPFRNNSLLWAGHSVLAAGVISFTAFNTVNFVETGRALAEERSTVGSIANREEAIDLRERRVEAEVTRHDVKGLTYDTSRANDVILRKAMSWTRLFNLLEATQPYEVKMMAVRPVFGPSAAGSASALASSGRGEAIPVHVEGVAKDLRAFLDFERSLIRDPHFDRVEPERTSLAKNGELMFDVAFLYWPEGKTIPGSDQADSEVGADGGDTARDETVREAAGSAGVATGVTAGDEDRPATPLAPAPDSVVEAPADPDAGAPKLTPAPAQPAPVESAAAAAPPPAPPADEPAPEPAAGTRLIPKRERKAPPTTIRKRPEGWQPPDPFAKKKGEEAAPAAGDQR